jgi:large subunit ribosomal protein L4
MNISVYKSDGSDSGNKIELSDSIFNVEVNEQVMYEAVRQYLAHQRQGTHKTKGRSEVNRTTKKAFKQKGTGGARRGSYKSPIVKGGGTIFGPQPRAYSIALNRKAKQLARLSALTLKARAEEIIVVENINMEAPSTKSFNEVMTALKVDGQKVLLLTDNVDKNVYLSSRNLPKASVKKVSDLNTYEIMNADVLIFTSSAIEALQSNSTVEAA